MGVEGAENLGGEELELWSKIVKSLKREAAYNKFMKRMYPEKKVVANTEDYSPEGGGVIDAEPVENEDLDEDEFEEFEE